MNSTSQFETESHSKNIFDIETVSNPSQTLNPNSNSHSKFPKQKYITTYSDNNDLTGENILYSLKKKTDSILKVRLTQFEKKTNNAYRKSMTLSELTQGNSSTSPFFEEIKTMVQNLQQPHLMIQVQEKDEKKEPIILLKCFQFGDSQNLSFLFYSDQVRVESSNFKRIFLGTLGMSCADIRLTFLEKTHLGFAEFSRFAKEDFLSLALDFEGNFQNKGLSVEQAKDLCEYAHEYDNRLFFVVEKKILYFSLKEEKSPTLTCKLFFDLGAYFNRQMINLKEVLTTKIILKLKTMYLAYTTIEKKRKQKQMESIMIMAIDMETKELNQKRCLFNSPGKVSVIPKNKSPLHVFISHNQKLIDINLKIRNDFVEVPDQIEIGDAENVLLNSKVSSCGQFLIQIRLNQGLVISKLKTNVELFSNRDKTLVDGDYQIYDLLNKELDLRVLV
jgi:hypothetical protein